METQDQLRQALMRARTELAFLLSDQVRAQAEEIRDMRQLVNRLVQAIDGNHGAASDRAPLL